MRANPLPLLALLLGACASDPYALAPLSAERPWPLPLPPAAPPTDLLAPPGTKPATAPAPAPVVPTAAPAREPAALAADAVADRELTLPELIDLAQRHNPATRAAWERARAAAAGVGLVESSYLPQLSVQVIAGMQRTPLPIPDRLVPKGYFTSDTRELLPALAVEWLLFDFGRRAGAERAARETAFVANVAFTGEHQRLIHAVTRDYLALVAARGRQRAAVRAVEAAGTDLAAVDARRERGLATVVDQAKARRQSARATLGLARADGALRQARTDLLASLGLPPATPLRVREDDDAPLPALPVTDLDGLLADALQRRPDLLASLGRERAAEARLDLARADEGPTLALAGRVFQNLGALRADDGPWASVNRSGNALLLRFSLPLSDGGRRDSRIAAARAEVEAARAEHDHAIDAAAREIGAARESLRTALAEYEAAVALADAARIARDAAQEAWLRGVGNHTSLIDADNSLAQADSAVEDARAAARLAAATLAFTTGAAGQP
ncbi:TolC family protein [Derxia gummosa]|uniref:Protein CyaE n=1 Tax=Derxia gummosa DSM 723 TaxID=1121388 RepID=A0A8B6X4B7_9BURK|nr:TolC family protein [Derxia gummosa]